MIERYSRFADTEYVQSFIINYEREQSWKYSESEAMEKQAEIRMGEIHEKAYLYTVLEAIIRYVDSQKQRYVDRNHIRRINKEFVLAEEEDRKKELEVYL